MYIKHVKEGGGVEECADLAPWDGYLHSFIPGLGDSHAPLAFSPGAVACSTESVRALECQPLSTSECGVQCLGEPLLAWGTALPVWVVHWP